MVTRTPPLSPNDVVVRLGGPTAVSRACDWPIPTIAAWQRRGSIPLSAWPKLIALADATEDVLLTNDVLAGLHQKVSA